MCPTEIPENPFLSRNPQRNYFKIHYLYLTYMDKNVFGDIMYQKGYFMLTSQRQTAFVTQRS